MGDVNCNDLDIEGKNRILVSLRNMYHTYQLKQPIKFPTQSTLSSQTLIDNFATNQSKFITEPGVFTTGFSDHDLVFGIRKISTGINREPKVVKTRKLKNYNPEKFRQNLRQVNWKNILKLSDVNEMSLECEKQFSSVLDWHAPYRQCKVRKTYAPYIDKDLGHKMFLRDLYKKRFNKSKSHEDWKQFQQLRNAVDREKPKKKREYFSKKLNENRGDIKGTWKTLNMALGKKSKSSTYNSIRVNGEDICNKKKIADELNYHFSTTAKRVLEEFPSSLSGDINLRFENYTTNMPKSSKQLYFKKITPQAVTKGISQLKNSKSGTVPVRFLNDASVVIAYLLSEILSPSLATDILPDNLKVARINAIYKGKVHDQIPTIID